MAILLMSIISMSASALDTPPELKGKTITYLLGYAPGGPHDIIARKITEVINRTTDINLVVLNKIGASGVIAQNQVLLSSPNGLTITQFGTDYILNYLEGIPSAPPPSAFTPVITVMEWHLSPIVKKGDIKTIKDLVEYHKIHPNSISYGTANSLTTLLTEYFLESINIQDALSVPYNKGATQMVSSVLSGETTFTLSSNWQPLLEGQKINVLAISGNNKQNYPNIVTLKEAGYNIELADYMGIFVHKDTPKHITEFYNRLLVEVLADPEIIRMIQNRNGKVIGGNLKQTQDITNKIIANREEMYRKYKHRINR